MILDFCVACGCRDPLSLFSHHLVPRCAGGTDDEKNLITLCFECHGRVHGQVWLNDLRTLTIAGIQAARARGVRLGNPRLAEARPAARAACGAVADRYAAKVLPVIREIQASGEGGSLARIADALVARGVPTARGGAWSRMMVRALLRRASAKSGAGQSSTN